MVKKKILAVLAIGVVTIGALVGTTLVGRNASFINAETDLSVAITSVTEEEGKYFANAYRNGNKVELALNGYVAGEGIILEANEADGAIYNIDAFQAITSIKVTTSENTDLKLHYGFFNEEKYVSSYVSVSHDVESGVSIDTSAINPTHFRLTTSTRAVIESIIITYSCDEINHYSSSLLEEYHIVGKGSFLGEHDGEWTPGAGPKLTPNPGNQTEEVMITLDLKSGDTFKFTKGVDWDGYTMKWKGSSAEKDYLVIEDDGDAVVKYDGTYTFYVKHSGNDTGIWTTAANVDVPGAVDIPASTKLYLKPNSNWTTDGARFAAYFFGNGDAWVSMVDSNADGIYEVTSPAKSYTNVIFCRMNPSNAENNWGNKWNQTGDLTYNGVDNLYVLNDGSWDAGEWQLMV